MADEPLPVLSYATPPERPQRYRQVRALGPFCGGLLLGGVASALVIWSAPAVWVNSEQCADAILVLAMCCVFSAIWTSVVLVALGWSVKRSLQPVSESLCAAIGFLCPLFGTTVVCLWVFFAILTTPAEITQKFTFFGVVGWSALAAAYAPFLLVKWKPAVMQPASPTRPGAKPWNVLVAAMIYIAMVAAARWISVWEFDRQCESFVAYVKSHYSAPQVISDQKLDSFQPWLTDDHGYIAILLADGRVVLMFRKYNALDEEWTAVLYCNCPIRPTELPGFSGGPIYVVPNLWNYSVKEQLDSQHYIVEWNP
jgi:hypothetical protein